MNFRIKYIAIGLLIITYWTANYVPHIVFMFIYAASILVDDLGGRELKRFDVSTAYSFLLLITCIAHLVAMLGLSDNPWFFTKFYSDELSGRAIYIFNIGSVIILETMRSFLKQDLIEGRTSIILNRLRFWPILLVSVSIFLFSTYFEALIKSFGSLGSFVELIVNGSVLLLSFIAHSSRRNVLVIVGYTLFLSIWALQYSYLRMEIMIPWVAYLSGDLMANRSIRRIHPYSKWVIFLSLLVFPPLFTFLGENRTKYYGSNKLNASIEFFNETGSGEGQTIMSRLSIIPQLSNIIMLTEKKGFYGGETLNYLGYVFIPRFIWPDKPLIKQGQWFAVEIGNAYYNKQGKANNSVNMTVPGEFYLNYQWTGLVIGCIIFGWFISFIWNGSNYYTLYGWVFRFYMIFLGLFSLGADLQIVPTLLAYFLVFKVLSFAQRIGSQNFVSPV